MISLYAQGMPLIARASNRQIVSVKAQIMIVLLIVLATAPDLKTARMLAKAALNNRLIACANLIPKLESHYWWKGKN